MAPTEIAAHLQSLEEHGYTILENVVAPDVIADLRERVREIEDETLGPVESGSPVDGSSQLRTAGLMRLDPMFWQVPINEQVLPVVEGVLGKVFLLTTFSAIDVKPGENKQPIHPDDALIPLERPHQPIVCTCMWAITDFTKENGATRLLPGTHKAEAPLDFTKDYQEVDGMIPAEMKAGSVLIFNGSLWHQASDNVTQDEHRLGLQVSYCAGWIRPFTNYFLSTPIEEVREYPERLAELLGYNTFNGVIGTITKPGTNRYANSAFVHPNTALGREGAKPASRPRA